MTVLLSGWNLRRFNGFGRQPFFNGVDLDNEQGICPHIGKPHPYPCPHRSCQEYEKIEAEGAGNFVDRTYEAICTFFQGLLRSKDGAAFERLAMHIVGYRDESYPEVLSVEGQRQQLAGNAHARTFVYNPSQVDGRPVRTFNKHRLRETTRKKEVTD